MPGYERRQRVVLLQNGFQPPDAMVAALKRVDPAATRFEHGYRLDGGGDTARGEHAWIVTYWASTSS